MEERHVSLKIETANNGLPIPVVDGVYLHSQYDPQKEAQKLIDNYQERIENHTNFLVFGLGFGYHLEELVERLKGREHTIKVFETNKEIIEKFFEYNSINKENIEIIHLENASTLYERLDFIKFLMEKPVIIRHEASFLLNKDKFIKFLSYKSPRNTNSYSNQVLTTSSTELTLIDDKSLMETINFIKENKRTINNNDFMTLALGELLKLEIRGTNL